MSNVYARNRKPSLYKKFLSIRLIDNELRDMFNNKKDKYFPKYHKKIFFKIHDSNLELIRYGSIIYDERTRSAGDIDSIDKCIKLVNLCINGVETSTALLTHHIRGLELYKKDMSEKNKKVANRFFRVIENYIIYEDSMKSYLKTLKRKRKKLSDKTK